MKPRRAQTLLLIRVLLYAALAALVFIAVERVAVVVAPVGSGLFLAYLLNPAVLRLEGKGVPRSIAIALLLLLFGGAVAAVVLLVPPLLSREIATFTERWQANQSRLATVILPWLHDTLHLPVTTNADEAAGQVLARLETALEGASGDVTSAVATALHTASGILRLVLAILLTPVFAIYFLSDYLRLRKAARNLVPLRYRESVMSTVGEVNGALASWVRGQLTVMVILGGLYATGLALTGIPLGVAIGIATGLMAFVPYVGLGVGLCFALASAGLDVHPASAVAGVLATFAAVQTLDTLIVTPRILGGRVGLSPVAVIFALTLGGELLGYAGLLLAVPSAAVFKVLLAHAHAHYIASPFYTGEPAVPPIASVPLPSVSAMVETVIQPPPGPVVIEAKTPVLRAQGGPT